MIIESVYFEIELTARRIKQYGQRILDANGFDITVDQWLVLKVVSENEGMSQFDICQVLIKDKSTISKMLKALEKKGFIERRPSSMDLRRSAVFMTKKSHQLIKKLLPLVKEVRQQGVKNLSQKEIKTLSKILSRIRGNLVD